MIIRWTSTAFVVLTVALLFASSTTMTVLIPVWTVNFELLAAALIVAGVRRCLPPGELVVQKAAVLLPRAERESWRGEIRAVLHACETGTEKRRQLAGFALAAPTVILTSWRHR